MSGDVSQNIDNAKNGIFLRKVDDEIDNSKVNSVWAITLNKGGR
ncbi:hypothetical protein SOASR030_18860 [Leminorella grimontii]|uniref:Uncharacterized protein n=1 Tax=Leminorella grimontii TaxID=82981 RepID=A0AAV5N3Q8_9GAMM|nr:hypothetical protein [Leminorella grimontii]GKX55774.1 hypothetical protein SOASR030_18860 [Leminorella grimontii]